MKEEESMIIQAKAPSARALVPFVSVENMMALVNAIGIETVLRDLAEYIEADFRRWQDFDKTPRVAAHSLDGVIELTALACERVRLQ